VKLLIHSTEYPPGPGGIGAQAHSLATELIRLDWQVRVVTVQSYSDRAEVQAFNARQPYEVVQVPSVRPALREGGRRFREVRRAIREWRPDIVMASGQRALWVVALAGPAQHVPWVAIVHATELDARKAWVRGLTRWALKRAQAIVAVSRHTGGYLRRLGVAEVPAFVIGNGADPGRFQRLEATAIEELRQRLDLVGARTILTVGNLTERKGQEVVISALPEVLRKVPEARYLMVGLPTEESHLRALSESLGVSHAVRFLGYLKHEELVAAYNCCDVFAMTSQHTSVGDFEGYGIAVVEAALCAKPAVVSEGSGLEEAVVAGETALVVPQSDAPATAEALVALLGNESLRAPLGQAARQRALAEQTWAARAVDYDRLLRDLTGGSQAAADLRLDSEVLP